MTIFDPVSFTLAARKSFLEVEMHLAHAVNLETDFTLTLDSPYAVCTPIALVRTPDELDKLLMSGWKLMSQELQDAKPKRVGQLYVACTVNPSKMLYEVALFMPFER
jgi:hypothetical protein